MCPEIYVRPARLYCFRTLTENDLFCPKICVQKRHLFAAVHYVIGYREWGDLWRENSNPQIVRDLPNFLLGAHINYSFRRLPQKRTRETFFYLTHQPNFTTTSLFPRTTKVFFFVGNSKSSISLAVFLKGIQVFVITTCRFGGLRFFTECSKQMVTITRTHTI